MAKTLLNCTNEVLKRVRIIQGESAILTSLTDSARQHFIDVAVQVWNEEIDSLYSMSKQPKPSEVTEGTITLVTSDRDYSLPTDLVQIRFPLVDQTNGQYITEYDGGYEAIFATQAYPANYTGLPTTGSIRPSDGQLYLDRIPTSEYNGRVYTYMYDKDLSMTLLTDTVPFTDAVFRAMVPAVAETWRRALQKDYDPVIRDESMSRAAQLFNMTPRKDNWGLTRSSSDGFDPLNA